jgi:tetratricopeptide (TPR) repeat protein
LLTDANSLFNSGKYKDAVEIYETYVKQAATLNFPTDAATRRIKDSRECISLLDGANKLFDSQQYGEAKTEYEKVLTINQLDPSVKKRLAECKQKINEQ